MKTKLIREEKYWPEIGKWVVSYLSPEYGVLQNSFNKNKEVADQEAIALIRKSILFHQEMKRPFEKSEVIIEV